MACFADADKGLDADTPKWRFAGLSGRPGGGVSIRGWDPFVIFGGRDFRQFRAGGDMARVCGGRDGDGTHPAWRGWGLRPGLGASWPALERAPDGATLPDYGTITLGISDR
jgi:hypothetical protein